ncbi:glycosyltransferase family 1 protein [Lentisphaerota bacterium ZTH]|nr:glycosyltransferase family 4 protein [Lentisphaerota bacterium]WET07391.1 glycosyltransferase family 1 protein [Lentisphaerota bacterium ZTH]
MYSILVSATSFDKGKSGVSVYICNCLRELAVEHRVEVLAFNDDISLMPQHDNITYLPVRSFLKVPVINMLWHLIWLPLRICWKRYDFVLLPAANRRAFLFKRGTTLAVVHDLSQYHIDCKYDPLRMFYIKRILPGCIRRADRVIAVSCSTQTDLKKYWHMPCKKLCVNYNGYDRQIFYPIKDRTVLRQIREKYALHKKYIFYISRIEHPGKNHLNLIKAYERLPEKLRREYDLVLAGSDWSGAEIVKAYAADSSSCDSIKFTGFVEYTVLPVLMSGAALYVFPSFFEGFGLSLVEAMACKIPIACSANSSLGEIGGDAAMLFDPAEPEQITESMVKILTDNNFRNKLVEAGTRRKELFDWRKHAEKLVACYESSKN